jgi:uncharacterized membrane protein YccC
MVKTQDILHFLYGQDFANGLRISFGAIIPAVIGYYFGDLSIGIAISLGALISSIPDTPGPVSHRRNALLATLFLFFVSTLITQLLNRYPILIGLELLIFGFIFGMFSTWGTRAAAVGTSTLIMVFLSIIETGSENNFIEYSLFVTIGCAWYTLLSLSLSQFMPYRLAQQELAEGIREIATFIRIKAEFYDLKSDTDKSFNKLIDQQIKINTHLDSLREILFKSKMIVKDSTSIGRILILIFSDILDLFEKTMATQYNYDEIRSKFGETDAFNEIRITLIRLANELDNFGYSLGANRRPKSLFNLQNDLENLKKLIDQTTEESNETTFVLKKILINVRSISSRVQILYSYFQNKEIDTKRNIGDISKFISHDVFDLRSFRNNLSFKSNTFRHSLRLAIILVIGYILSYLFDFQNHVHWILLTILVILKPGWSLTKERNFQRLIGTIVGGIAGIIILIWVKDPSARFVMLLIFMVLTYSLIRINYIISVMFMTPYLLILFSFLGQDTMEVAQERIFATFIGSGLAFISSYIIFPSWEKHKIQDYMQKLLVANYNYFTKILETVIIRNLTETDYKLARKEVYIATANMASAFQRMITEPKSKQKDTKGLNKFIVFNHLFSSHTANLISTVRNISDNEIAGEPVKNLKKVLLTLEKLIKSYKTEAGDFIEIKFQIPDQLLIDIEDSAEKKFINDQILELRNISNNLHKNSEAVLGQSGKIHLIDKDALSIL